MISIKDIHTFQEERRILLRANEFICLRPHPSLCQYISNYNITFPTKNLIPASFTAIPNGCATLSIEMDNKNLFVNLDGPITKPYIYGNLLNQLKMVVSIEFSPAGLYALTGIPQSKLTDTTLPFDAVNPKLTQSIYDVVEKAKSTHELVTGLDMLLLENMYTEHHPQLKFALQNIITYAGNTSVKWLSDETHYSERQLNRLFNQHIGMSAKSFSRLIRINKTFRLLKKPSNSITLISDVMGFHDLSHFVRDFKSVCGVTPQEYRNNMSDFYINTGKF